MTEADRRRLRKVQGRKVKAVSVWFIEDLLLAGQDQVWGPRENWNEFRQAAAGYDGEGRSGQDRGISGGGIYG